MLNTVVFLALAAALVLAPLAASASQSRYKFDYIPKRSDTYRNRIGHMENLSKQRARASADYMRRHHLSLF